MVVDRNLTRQHLFGDERGNLDDLLFDALFSLSAFKDSISLGLTDDSVGLGLGVVENFLFTLGGNVDGRLDNAVSLSFCILQLFLVVKGIKLQ